MPLFYPKFILETLLSGKDVDSLKTSEARKIVSEFWIQVYSKSLGQTNQRQLERACMKALKQAGLEFFA